MKVLVLTVILTALIVFKPGYAGKPGFLAPEVTVHSLDNGVKIFHIDDQLPRSVFYVSVGFGKLYEQRGSAGIAELFARTLAIAGSKKYPGNELYRELEAIGGQISFSAGWENIVIELKVLTRHSDLAFSILVDILENPLFDEDSLNAARVLFMEQVKREADNPRDLAFMKLREIIFSGSGYGGIPSQETINAVSPAHLEEIWGTYFRGGNIRIAASTSMKSDLFFRKASEKFSSLRKGDRKYYEINNIEIVENIKKYRNSVVLVPLEIDQATIVTGTIAPPFVYEGNYALQVMNHILGGGSFSSRLTSEIRVDRGLAYSVFSLVRNRHNAGIFMSFVQTRNENVPQVISLIRENIEEISTSPVSDNELNRAKDAIINSYVFRFEKTTDILSNYLSLDYYGLDSGYYVKYPESIRDVSASEILARGSRLFDGGLVTVVVGRRSLAETLESFGQVVIIEND